MTDPRRIPIALGVFGVLLALTVWVVSQKEKSDPPLEPEMKLPKLKSTEIDGLEIQKPGQPLVKLSKVSGGETWRMTAPVEAEADESSTKSAIEMLGDLDFRGVAATKVENHKALEITEAQAIRVKAFSGKLVKLDMFIGASKGGNTMARFMSVPSIGSDKVLSVGGSLRYAFDKASKDWRNKQIVKVEADKIGAFEIASEKGIYKFQKVGTEWAQEKGSKAIDRFDASKVGSLISSFANMFASDFAEPAVTPESTGFQKPSARIKLTVGAAGDAGTPSILLIERGNVQGSEGFYVRREGSPVTYVVSKYLGDLMTPDTAYFQKPEEKKEEKTTEKAKKAAPAGEKK